MIAAADFFQRPEVDIFAENSLKPGELIVEIHVDKPQDLRSAYRKNQAEAGLRLAARGRGGRVAQEGGVARDVRIVIGSAAPVPWRAKAAEEIVEERGSDAALAARAAQAALDGATPLGKNAYKLPIVAAAVRRTLLASAGLAVDAEADVVSAPAASAVRTPSPSIPRCAAGTFARRRCSSRRETGTSTRASTRRRRRRTGAFRSWGRRPDGQPACLDDCRAGRACFEGEG